jgi:amino-acid N-acetyltransferase
MPFMQIAPASQNSFAKAIRLLEKSGLPTDDLDAGKQLFVAEEGDQVAGTVAVEYDFENALLRSLSVAEDKRDTGIAKRLVEFIEDYVRKQGVQNVYLLTTTARDFFLKRGYKTIDRNDVPDFIKTTAQYSILCPSTSTVMQKEL